MTKRRYIYEVTRDGKRLIKTPILKRDDIWITIPHRKHTHAVTRLLRVRCVFSEREAWRRHLPIAREAARSAAKRIGWLNRDLERATVELTESLKRFTLARRRAR